MKEKEILEKIGYKGEYTKEVKKKLKDLLKKYHPDHYKGSDDTFKAINKVKKELESGKKYDYSNFKKDSSNKTINPDDYLWYLNKIDELTRKKESLIKLKDEKQKKLFSVQDKYRIEYDIDIANRDIENDNSNDMFTLHENRQLLYMILTIVIVIMIVFIFIKIYYPIIVFVILIILLIIKIIDIHKTIEENINDNKKVIDNSRNSFKKINVINKDINNLYREIWEIDCEIGRLTTKINLYYNHLK